MNEPNLTAQYLDQRIKDTGGLDGTFLNLLRKTLSKKLKLSVATDRIEDHIHTAMCGLIYRDALRERILEGLPISDTHLATFVLRCAYNEIRYESRNPVARELYGATTPKERKDGYERGCFLQDPMIVWIKKSGEPFATFDLQDMSGPMSAPQTQDNIYYEQCWQQIEAVLKAKKPKLWEKYLKILRMRAEGARINDIVETEGYNTHWVNKAIRETRDILQAEISKQQLAIL